MMRDARLELRTRELADVEVDIEFLRMKDCHRVAETGNHVTGGAPRQ
jgi:hypothetical protein